MTAIEIKREALHNLVDVAPAWVVTLFTVFCSKQSLADSERIIAIRNDIDERMRTYREGE